MSNLTLIVRRLQKQGLINTLVYFLGRFSSVRAASRVMRTIGASPVLTAGSATHIEAFDPKTALRTIESEGYFAPLRLHPEMLDRLLHEASQAQPRVAHDDWAPVTPDLLKQRTLSGEPILIEHLQSAGLKQLTEQIAQDPQLTAVAVGHLGGPPRSTEVRVHRSLVAEASVEYRESKNQTVSFHFDVNALNFIYVFFYLTDTTRLSGAHELITRSQHQKKVRHLFGSARQTDEEIYGFYGKDRSVVLEGPAGFGFIEDTSCFHRALAPVDAPRLVLQIRYS